MAAKPASPRGDELPTDRIDPSELPGRPGSARVPGASPPSSVRQGLLRDLDKDSGRFSPLETDSRPLEPEPDDGFSIGVLDTSLLAPDGEALPTISLAAGAEAPPAPARDPAPPVVEAGRRFGPFLLLKQLTGGAMGAVYQAVWEPEGQLVALKVVPAGFSHARRDRFVQEIQALSKLRHPQIVAVATTGTVKGRFYCAMEYLEARGFDKLLAQPWFPLLEKVRILSQVAKGLHYAHGQAIIHRDVKPENILVCEQRACMADFGLARDQEEDPLLTKDGTVMGTPLYMAPEQASGAQVGPAADIYALGAILYEILTGQPPHALDHVHDVMYAQIHHEPAPPRQRNPQAPELLEQICLRALRKRPEERQGSAGQFADDLDTWCRTVEQTGARPAEQGWRRPFIVGVAVGAAAAALLGTLIGSLG